LLLLLSFASAIACRKYSEARSINSALLKAPTLTARVAASLTTPALPVLTSTATRHAIALAMVHWAQLLTLATMA
jgi:hypothetical protein